MNLVYIIGNGLDKNLGYASSYPEIYTEYCKEKESDSNLIKVFKNLITPDAKLWSDFEMAIPVFGAKLNNENEMMECVKDFQQFTMDYLKAEDARVMDAIKFDQFEAMNLARLQYGKGLRENEIRLINESIPYGQIKVDAISFNYTSAVESIMGKNNVIYIHGTLDRRDGIFGVDSLDQLSNLPYVITERLKRKIIKPAFNDYAETYRANSAKNLIQEADLICVYGASLGDSDRTWRLLIKEWIESDPSHHIIVYDHEMWKTHGLPVYDWHDLQEDKSLEFMERWGLGIDDHINQIHFPYDYNIFALPKTYMDSATSKNSHVKIAY